MKVVELELGKLYQCILSDYTVLIVEAPVLIDRETNTTELKKSGKVWMEEEKKFSLIELHDGQLIEFKS